MKEKLKRFFTIDIKKNFTEYKFRYGVAIGIAIACIWCTIGIYAAPYIVQSKKTNAVKEIAHADTSTIELNTYYSFDIGETWTESTIPQVNNTTTQDINANFTITYNNISYSGSVIHIIRSKSSVANSISFAFRNSSGNYPHLNVSASTNGKQLWLNFNTDSGSLTPTTNDTLIIKFTSGVSSFPTDLTNNLKKWLTVAILNYNVTSNITNGTLSQSTIQTNTTNTLQITPETGYVYPETISYTGTASAVDYYEDTGEIIITNPTSDFTITAECPRAGRTIEVGYYIIYPPEIPSTADTIELSFHIISLLSSTIGNSEPLTPVISSTLYNYLDRQTGLQSGLFALTSLQDTEPRELWRDYSNNEQLNGAVIIYVPSQKTIIGHDLANCLLSITYNQYDALRYWGYGSQSFQ